MPVLKKIVFYIVALLIFFYPTAYAEETKKAVLVVVDHLTLEELEETNLPNIESLIRQGGLAVMNTNTAGGRTRENAHATIGAGKVAYGGAEAGLAFPVGGDFGGELAGNVYRSRTGQSPPPDALVHLGLAGMLRLNEGKTNTGRPGLLGETLHLAGYKTALIGNADENENPPSGITYGRQAATIAMDRSGQVDYPFMGEELTRSGGNSLLLNSMDPGMTIGAVNEALNKADLVVVETGDTVRLEKIKNRALDRIYDKAKKESLEHIDLLVGEIITALREYDSLMLIFSTTPSREAIQGSNLLTPIIYWKNHGEESFLVSGTTRRQGIVANTDIAPTVLSHFDLPIPVEMTGRPMYPVAAENTLATLIKTNHNLIAVHKARPPMVQGYVFGQIIAVLLTVTALIFWRGKIKYFQPVLLALSSIPLAFLFMGFFPGLPLGLFVFGVILTAGIVTGLSMGGFRRHHLGPFMAVALFTGAAILLDIILGAPLMRSSVLGYDPMGGARYYGLGNEFMGVLIGSLVMGTAALFQIFKSRKLLFGAAISIYGAALFVIAGPHLGTNAGGALAAALAFGFTAYQLAPAKVTRTQLAWAGTAVACLFCGFIFWDAGRSVEAQSHFGRTVNLLRTNGIWEAYNIIVRKVLLNLRLLRWTIWGEVFLVTLLGIALLFYRPIGLMRRVQEKYPYLSKGFWGVTVGSIAAFLFNDSGIVAAATMSIFAAAPLMYVIIEEWNLTAK
ncbi:MAG: hypothetical protein PHT78_06280 [Desulfitobacteriaceae bacterium]|nr:hypothetical protein [Desulfitobacteriaceae bacterium]